MPTDTQILEQNPWWRTRDAIGADPHLARLREMPFRWDPPVLADIALRPGDLDTLRGPRQVGKTTTAKRLIQRLLDRGEERVLYYAFDLEREEAAIPDVIRRAKSLHRPGASPWYIFLDEVTSIPGWQRGIKYAWDVGLTRSDYVLCTGSSARRMGTEQLPGRRRGGRNYVQLPMSFRDFCRSTRDLPLPDATVPVPVLLEEDGRALLRELYLLSEPLDAALTAYRRVGGFPAAVADHVARGEVSRESIAMGWAMLSHEVRQAGHDPTSALKLIERVGLSLGSTLSWSAAAEAMGAGSHNTARDYARALAESFTLLMVYYWSQGGGFEPRKQRKIYLLDPLIGLIPAAVAPGARAPNPDGTAESLVAAALFRSSIDHATLSEATPGGLGYWRSKEGNEIDFVVPAAEAAGRRIPIEVKGDNAGELRRAVLSIRRSFGRGLVATRRVFEPDGDVPLVPIAVLLAALRENTERKLSGI